MFLMTAKTQALYQLCLESSVDTCFERKGPRAMRRRMVADLELAIPQEMQIVFPIIELKKDFERSRLMHKLSIMYLTSLYGFQKDKI